ncbi:MAG: PKD domain-containing protein [Ferruginibacter sp.]
MNALQHDNIKIFFQLKHKVLFVVISLLIIPQLTAQNFTNKGKEFWLCFPSHTPNIREGIYYYAKMSLFITSDKNSSGSIAVPGGANISFNVTAGNVAEVDIPYAAAHITMAEAGTVIPKGIHVQVDGGKPPVVVYAHIYAGFRSAASLVLPVPVLGKKYYSMNALQRSTAGSKSQLVVVAIAPNTAVQVTAMKDGIRSTPFVVNLPAAGDVYELQDDMDLSGTLIESIPYGNEACKKIAVFSGSSAINISTNSDCLTNDSYDPLYQQLYPVNAWGKKYGFIPFENYSFGNPYRVMAAENNTTVKLNGATIAVLNAGEYYPAKNEFGKLQTGAAFITADKPVSVAQYAQSSACSGAAPEAGKGYGDADMVLLNPVEQNLNTITLFSSQKENIFSDARFINVLLPQNATASFKINDKTPSANWQSMPQPESGFSFAKISLPAGQTAFSLSADSAFNAIAYGFGDYESYAYAAGTNVKDLYRTVSISNEFGEAAYPASCRQTKFKLQVTYPYRTDKLVWKFNNVFPDKTVNNPAATDSFFIGGKKVYKYKLDTELQLANAGEYAFSVVANDPVFENCQGEDKIEYSMQVLEKPVADFEFMHSGCITDSVRFTNKAGNLAVSAAKWFWDFDDGLHATEQLAAHKYTSGKLYKAKHWLINDIGCMSDTAVKDILLSDVPLAKFSAVTGACQYSDVLFTDESSAGGVIAINKWSWNLGDKEVITDNNKPFTHQYKKDSSMVVSLQVETAAGCKSVLYQRALKINPVPVADFSAPVFCLPEAGKFINHSFVKEGNSGTLQYEWDFGDGAAVANAVEPVHLYQSEGPFTVHLKVTSAAGCVADTGKIIHSIYSKAHLQADVPVSSCIGDTVKLFVKKSTVENSVLDNFYYSIDGSNLFLPVQLSNSTDATAHHWVGDVAGVHSIKIVGKIKTTGCFTDTVSKEILVHDLPSAEFNLPRGLCEKEKLLFENRSSSADGNIIKWEWDFGNGNTSIDKDGIQMYRPGIYNVKLAVETNTGCRSATALQQIKINNRPLPGFVMPEICLADGAAVFENSSSIADPSGQPLSYEWSFGDPNATMQNPDSSFLKDPVHHFTAAGFYSIKLKAASAEGCSSDTTKILTVNGAVPEAAFTVERPLQLCSDKNVIIEDQSTVDFGTPTRLEIFWDTEGNPVEKETEETPVAGKKYTHQYPLVYGADKIYTAKLVVFSGNGCKDELTQALLIRGLPIVKFDTIESVCMDAAAFSINKAAEISGMEGTGFYSGDGISPAGFIDPVSLAAGTHIFKYSFETTAGCTGSKTQQVKILPVPQVNAGEDKFIEQNEPVTLTGNGTGASCAWTPLIRIAGDNTLRPVVTPEQTTVYRLTVTSAEGCKASDEVKVEVFSQLHIPNAFSPNGDGVNDTWKIPLIENYNKDVTVSIFNRNGQRVFYSQGYAAPWDGRFKNELLSAGSYIYVIHLNKKNSIFKGNLLLIR